MTTLVSSHPSPEAGGSAMTAFCPAFHHAVELVGKRWTGVILRAMLGGAARFSDITAAVPGLSDRLLSERLKHLETEGIVIRTVIPETPVRVHYGLTEKGQDLTDVVIAISAWAEAWVSLPAGAEGCPGTGEEE